MFDKLPLFADLTTEQIDCITAGVRMQSFPRGAVVITQGDLSDSLFVLLSGRLKAYIADDSGREILLGFIEPDDTFGELSLLDGCPRSASVMTVENSKLAILPKEHFLYCLEQYPTITLALLKNLAGRSRRLVSKVGDLGLLDVYGRVVNVLMACTDKDDNGCYVTKPITHQDLANAVGASREMITRILSDLKKGGYITVQKRQIMMRHQLPTRW